MISYGSHNGAPYVIQSNNQIQSGLIWDIGHELAYKLNARAHFMKLPRKRQATYLEQGKIDVLLLSNPKWLNNHQRLNWSNALFEEQDLLVSLQHTLITKEKDLHGLNIGTIRGYQYNILDAGFEKGHYYRDDVSNLVSNFDKLRLRRIDALVDSSILINYRLSTMSNPEIFKISPVVVSQHVIQAAVSPSANIPSHQIIDALNALKKEGVIDKIIKKYQ